MDRSSRRSAARASVSGGGRAADFPQAVGAEPLIAAALRRGVMGAHQQPTPKEPVMRTLMHSGNLARYGGLIATVVLVAFGVGAVYSGIDGRDMVRDNLRQENIVGTPDSTIPGQVVDTGSEARAFADVMRRHALEATGGKTYAEMDRFLAKGGGTTSDEKAALVQGGRPVDNPARNIWVTETALATALNTAYFAEQVALFSIVMGIALLLTGVGFGVVSLRLLKRDREAADTRVPASGSTQSA
jgi:hypothetical protein